MEKSKIGIIGGGVLGGAMKGYFTEAKIYDKYKELDSLEEVKAQDLIFVCVPTPYTQGIGFDYSVLDEVFGNLAGLEGKVVVIRSTVLPGTTEKYQEKYPQLKLMFNPEFLDEATAQEDYSKPDKQIIGYTDQSKDLAQEVLDLLPQAPFMTIMAAHDAEMVKYMVNNYYALRVIFANQVYDLCQKAGLDYEAVKEAFIHDRRVADGHFKPVHKGYRGYGGKCLRKDMDSMIDFFEQNGVEPRLFRTVKEINLTLNDGK